MAHLVSDPPPDFSWLRATYRPSADEVADYAAVIAVAEGHPDQASDAQLRIEAELQLWIWHTETRTRTLRANRRRAGRRIDLVR